MTDTQIIDAPERAMALPPKDRPLAAVKGESQQIFGLITALVEKGEPEKAEKLFELYERVSERQARIEFATAKAAFQEACPFVPFDKKTDFVNSQGARVKYGFASLRRVVEHTRPHLMANGLGISFDGEIEPDKITCVCKLAHVNGQVETCSVGSRVDEGMRGMSNSQKTRATMKSLRRLAIEMILGIVTDEAEEATPAEIKTISQEEQNVLNDLLVEMDDRLLWKPNKATGRATFFELFTGNPAGTLSQIQTTQFQRAVTMLRAKTGAKQ